MSTTAVAARKAFGGNLSENQAVLIGPGAKTAANRAGVMTGAVVLTSDRILVSGALNASFQGKWTGTPTGTFTFEMSNDEDPDNDPVAGWTNITLPAAFAALNPAGTATSASFDFQLVPWRWMRAKYTNSASTGVLVLVAEAKGGG